MPTKITFPYQISDGVTQSLLSAWVSCRQYAFYMIRGWESGAPKRALQQGSMMHEALENWHGRGIDRLPTRKWRTKALKKGANADDIEDDIGIVASLLPGYIKRYTKKDRKKKFVEVEGLFDVEFESYRLRGRIDGVYELGGKLWILETKTTSKIEEAALKLYLNFDFQSLFYVTALQEMLGRPIAGVLYNLIRKPQIKQGKLSKKAYWDRVETDTETRPDFYYKRFETRFTRARIKAFQEELHMKLDLFANWIAAGDGRLMFKNEMACRAKWNCRYLQACGDGNMNGYKKTGKLFSELEDD